MDWVAVSVAVMFAAAPAAATVQPSPSACAAAWNYHADHRLQAELATARSHSAFIQSNALVGKDTWSKAGGGTSSQARGCVLSAILRSGKIFDAWGVWHARTIPRWQGIAVSSGQTIRFPANARVHEDGTVGFHG